MPALNKQTLINLLIDSPLREPIKINLIDIVNNTNDADLPKVYPTITKELEIFEKASERRLKLSAETIAKLQGKSEEKPADFTPTPPTEKLPSPPVKEPSTPPVETPPVETPPSTLKDPVGSDKYPTGNPPLSVPPLDLPPFPTKPTEELPPAPPTETPNPLADASSVTPGSSTDADEEALKEIQKELDNLKVSATEESAPPAPPTTTPEPTPPETPLQT